MSKLAFVSNVLAAIVCIFTGWWIGLLHAGLAVYFYHEMQEEKK